MKRSPAGKSTVDVEGKLKGMLKEMMKENRYRWARLEESLGKMKELERMKSREEEWQREQEEGEDSNDEKKIGEKDGGRNSVANE